MMPLYVPLIRVPHVSLVLRDVGARTSDTHPLIHLQPYNIRNPSFVYNHRSDRT